MFSKYQVFRIHYCIIANGNMLIINTVLEILVRCFYLSAFTKFMCSFLQ